MNDETINSPRAMLAFLKGNGNIEWSVPERERCAWIAKMLKVVGYRELGKKDKSIVRAYLQRGAHYSRAQLTRVIGRCRGGEYPEKRLSHHNVFSKKYGQAEILLLAKTDEAHQTLSGGATKKLFERAYGVYHDAAYQHLKDISISHLYNLRHSVTYQRQRLHFEKTKSNSVPIGERRKPRPDGKPGYIRIDTVHQGDQDKEKGVYHINAVDEVTQFEVISSVEKISENHLIPVLESIIERFPFVIINFHSDCGSEYINQHVVRLLNKLHIELTKSRARHCNDNALAECKNGAIVRKYLGYVHIPQKHAELINEFYSKYLIPYINFHRPCYFPKAKTDRNGKEKKVYPYEAMMTPYEKLKSLENAGTYLKVDVSFEDLDQQVLIQTDLEAGERVQEERKKLFQSIFKESVDKA